jgi:hypothetical protein
MRKPGEGAGAPDAVLRTEAVLFARYLLDSEPAPALVDRYVAASEALLGGSEASADVGTLRLARNSPRTLPFLDAATGILRPQSLLRKKLLLMASILEASPAFAPDFLPERLSAPRLLGRLALCGVATAAKITLGTVLLIAADRRGHG